MLLHYRRKLIDFMNCWTIALSLHIMHIRSPSKITFDFLPLFNFQRAIHFALIPLRNYHVNKLFCRNSLEYFLRGIRSQTFPNLCAGIIYKEKKNCKRLNAIFYTYIESAPNKGVKAA